MVAAIDSKSIAVMACRFDSGRGYKRFDFVAQLVAHRAFNPGVAGSIPVSPTITFFDFLEHHSAISKRNEGVEI